jgi:hypothetical protein
MNKYGFKHEQSKISSLLINSKYEIPENEYLLIDIETSTDNVIASKQLSNEGYIFFSKQNAALDPIKEENMISIYTTKKTIMYYDERTVNKIETDLIIEPNYTLTGNYIKIFPNKSTFLKINLNSEIELRVSEDFENFILSLKNNIFSITPTINYSEENNGLKIATIQVIKKIVTKNYDMRILGGGLPEKYEDNYDLLDIAHIKGRPYRIGGTVIISLPKKLEIYKEIIESAVNKHSSAGDYAIIIFE